MWWKLSVAVAVGVAIGSATATALLYRSYATTRDMRVGYVASGWSSKEKDWSDFADWLRHGGRRLLRDAAFSAARKGISEADVRAMFGPPDMVVVGDAEFQSYSAARMKGSAGAYFYKIGRFAAPPNRLDNEALAIVFDPTGRVIYCLGFGVGDGDMLADIETDTRTERRIAQ